MKVSTERIEGSQVVLDIEVEPDEVERSLAKAYQRLVNKTHIPGFRKGKAPRPVLERYLGSSALLEDALNHLLPELYDQAVQEQEVEAIAQPHIEVTKMDPVVFKATVSVRPTIELGDYHGIRVSPEPVEVAETEVDVALEQLRSFYAPWQPVERETGFGDLLTIDIEGSINGKPFLNRKGLQYHLSHPLLPDIESPVPGFGEQLEGMGNGENKEFSLPFPSDYTAKAFAGKEYSFKVLVSEIKEKHLPELDDEFAKGAGFETIDLLRERITSNLRARAEEEANQKLQGKVMEAVAELAQVELPAILVEREMSDLMDERRRSLGGGLEDYLKNANKTEEELRDELRPVAETRVTHSLMLGKVAELEKITVSPAEVEAEVERLAEAAGDKADELRRAFDSPAGRQSLEMVLLSRKIKQRLVEIAIGQEPMEAAESQEARKEEEDEA